jgi:hypothetical protein
VNDQVEYVEWLLAPGWMFDVEKSCGWNTSGDFFSMVPEYNDVSREGLIHHVARGTWT